MSNFGNLYDEVLQAIREGRELNYLDYSTDVTILDEALIVLTDLGIIVHKSEGSGFIINEKNPCSNCADLGSYECSNYCNLKFNLHSAESEEDNDEFDEFDYDEAERNMENV